MNLHLGREHSLRRPAAAIMAGLLTVSLLPASALTARAEEIDPGMALVVASAEVSSDPFDFESDKDAGNLEQEAQSFPASFDLRHCDTDGDGVYENYVTPVKLQTPSAPAGASAPSRRRRSACWAPAWPRPTATAPWRTRITASRS